MSKKYLDNNGLQHFWTKIKNYIDSHVTGTKVPTADTTAKFDLAKHMNSEDMTDAEITNFIDRIPGGSSLLDFFYPVGVYFETSDANFNPNTAWGGTWVLESGGNFHIAAGNGYPVGTTGGEATHTLTTDEIPAHDHTVAVAYPFTAGGAKPFVPYASNTTEYGAGYSGVVKTSGGNGHAHNNIPPYVAVNRWHRTA